VSLSDVLEESKEQIVRGVMERLVADRCETLHASLVELVDDLTQSLRRGRVDLTAPRRYITLGTDPDLLLAKLDAIRACLFALLGERKPHAEYAELGLVTEWFAATSQLILREHNRVLRILVDAVPDHLALHDADGRILFTNRAARNDVIAALGGLERDPVGQGLGDIPGLEDFAAQVEHGFAQAFDGRTTSSQVRFPSAEGWHWREQIVSPYLDGDGAVRAVAIVSRNDHARRLSEDRLRLLSKLNTVGDTLDQEGALSAVVRLSVPELADWSIVDVVDEGGSLRRHKVAHRDPAEAARADELAAAHATFSRAQLERLRSGQSILVGLAGLAGLARAGDELAAADALASSLAPLATLAPQSVLAVPFTVMGEMIAVATFVTTGESKRRYDADDVAVAEDLARRASQMIENARLNQRVQESEARFRVALSRSNITVFEEDADGKLRWLYNPQLGYDDREIIGRPIEELIATGDSAKVAATRRQVHALASRAHVDVEGFFEGTRRHLTMSFEALRSATGTVVGTTGAIVDMTEAKRAQEDLTQALGFRDRMMGILGHDLRNPVAAIQGMAGLLMLEQTLDDGTRDGLRRIDQSVRRISEMIQTVLDFARTRFQGSIPVSPSLVDLRELCATIVDETKAANPRRQISFAAGAAERGEWDPARMAQVLSNLIANALTHGERDQPVRISLTGDEQSVAIAVVNRGPAIPAAKLDKLFEPFERGEASSLESRGGLGLGLFIAQQIVRSHGGAIAATSADGLVTFTIELPRQPPRAP
jgi:PAS domain S-box-containing protein